MNSQQQHEDPGSDAAARAAQLAAMALSIAEGVARLRAERLAGQASDDERRAGALRAQHRADQAAAWLDGRASAQPAARRDALTTTPAIRAGDAMGSRNAVGSHGVVGPQDVAGSASASVDPADGSGRARLSIVCTPQGLRDQAFPVDMSSAMATAPQAARDAVQAARNPQAGEERPRLAAVSIPGPGGRGGVR